MKLKNHQLNNFTVFVLPVVFIVAILGIAFLVNYLTHTVDISKKYENVSPKENLVSTDKLVSQLYFNTILGEETALTPVVDVIHTAKHSIEIAMFSFDSDKVKKALYEAASKGVHVTLILDASRGDKHDRIFSELPTSIERINVGIFDPNTSTNTIYMHHKLLLVDRGYDSEKLITGSMNYTSKGEKYEQSFMFATSDKILTKIYEKELDLLKKGISGKNKLLQKEYYPWAAHVTYPDSYVDVWFSPGFALNSIKAKIIQEIQSAKKSIDIIMWQFTENSIAEALVKKAKDGVHVRIIADDLAATDASSKLSYIKKMLPQNSNIEIITDIKSNSQISPTLLHSGFNPFIHHHVMIIDDTTTIFGTSNWSTWGFTNNDEDTIVTNNLYITGEFKKIFDHFYQTLK